MVKVYFVRALQKAFEINGISVSGDALDIDDLSRESIIDLQHKAYQLNVHYSPPLSEIAMEMMKESQNLYAENLFLTLGTHFDNGLSHSGQNVIEGLLKSWNVAPDQFSIADGSGLSRYNLITAGAIVTVLEQMKRNSSEDKIFEATLPIAGKDGTLLSRMIGTAAEGNVQAKTGSMTGVRTLAGYVNTASNERLAFAIMANNFLAPPSQIINIIDRAVAVMAEFNR